MDIASVSRSVHDKHVVESPHARPGPAGEVRHEIDARFSTDDDGRRRIRMKNRLQFRKDEDRREVFATLSLASLPQCSR